MLKKMLVQGFTVFKDEVFEFSPAVNIIVGENSVGKTHLLKLAYALMTANQDLGVKLALNNQDESIAGSVFSQKLLAVFRAKSLPELFNRYEMDAMAGLAFDNSGLNFKLSLKRFDDGAVVVTPSKPANHLISKPIYFPTRELLTIYPGFVALYNARFLQFEETWRDTCDYLGVPLLKDSGMFAGLIAPLEAALGGKVVLESNGEFYLQLPNGSKLSMPMMAEGYRKLAMLAHLIANGMIAAQGCLFWDEPEANLNPRLIRLVARVIHDLGKNGVQIFIASHSFFLLKELDLLARQDTLAQRFIGLSRQGNDVLVEQADKLSGLEHVVALDEELAQYDREMDLAYG
ncbi:MAG: hypothetical protein RL748_3448 [Pseudomonadota bacterium]|jgi:predicted ATPase